MMPKFFADETLTVAASAIGPTLATLEHASGQADYAQFGPLETGQVRYRFNAAPTDTVGALLEIGDTLICRGDEIEQVKFIRTGGTSGTLFVQYGSEG
jgi:hypothetical protein